MEDLVTRKCKGCEMTFKTTEKSKQVFHSNLCKETYKNKRRPVDKVGRNEALAYQHRRAIYND